MLADQNYPIDIVETKGFVKQIRALLSDEEVIGLKTFLAGTPEDGVIIPGTNGLRKIRWAMEGRGKRRGARVIYYYRDLNLPLFLITAYAKNERYELSRHEKKLIGRLVDELVNAHSEEIAKLVRLSIAQKGA